MKTKQPYKSSIKAGKKSNLLTKKSKKLPRVAPKKSMSSREQMSRNLEANKKAGKYSSGVGVGY